MTEQGRKTRVEFTPLEAEAALHALREATGHKDAWKKFERKRGAVTAGSALGRAISKLKKEVQQNG